MPLYRSISKRNSVALSCSKGPTLVAANRIAGVLSERQLKTAQAIGLNVPDDIPRQAATIVR
jgi:hypothetical protein